MRVLLLALFWAFLVALIFTPLGWLAYCYVAPNFGLPELGWQFFCAAFAARSLLGTSSGTSTRSV